MRGILKSISEWAGNIAERSRKRSEARRHAVLLLEADRVVQVREFDGKLYVCYGDVPVIGQSQLDCPIETAVKNARMVYCQYFKTGTTNKRLRQ